MRWGVMLLITKLLTICGFWKRKEIGMRRAFCRFFTPQLCGDRANGWSCSDYTYLLDKCYGTGAPYIAMFEDDIIVADGWMVKTRQAFREIERNKGWTNWLYLRQFYTEISMQWEDTDFWYQHISLTVGIGALIGFALLVLIRYQFPSTKRHLNNGALGVVSLITIPSFIALVFMIGKYSLFPPKGVIRMNKYGCCTQALVFPRNEVPGLVAYLRGIGAGQTDTMIEECADANGKE